MKRLLIVLLLSACAAPTDPVATTDDPPPVDRLYQLTAVQTPGDLGQLLYSEPVACDQVARGSIADGALWLGADGLFTMQVVAWWEKADTLPGRDCPVLAVFDATAETAGTYTLDGGRLTLTNSQGRVIGTANVVSELGQTLTLDASAYSDGEPFNYLTASTWQLRETLDAGVGRSRESPAPPDRPVVVRLNDGIGGDGVLRLTLLSTLRGEAADSAVLAWSYLNDTAPAGKEYVVARFRAEAVAIDEPDRPIELHGWRIEAVSRAGVVYPDPPVVYGIDPTFTADLYGGAHEGFVVLLVESGDDPLLAFDRSSDHAAWFQLHSQ